jgi:hypothetical protein
MGYLSQAGHVGLRIQSTKGVYADPGGTGDKGIFMYTRSGSIGGNRELIIPDPEIGGNRDIPDASLGPISYSGEYEYYARMDSLVLMMYAALGNVTKSGATATGYTWVITPDDEALPWVSVEERIADGYQVFKYTDCKVNTLHLEAEANGYLMGSSAVIGLTQATTTATAANARVYDTTPLVVGTNVLIQYNDTVNGLTTLPAKSFNMDVNNNIEDDDFRLGSLALGDLVEKRRETTFGVTIRPQDANIWKTAMWGRPGATAPEGVSTKGNLKVTITTYEDIPGTTGPAVKYSMVIDFPKAIIAPFNVEPSGDDVVEHDLEIRPVRPAIGTPLFTATIVNGMQYLEPVYSAP